MRNLSTLIRISALPLAAILSAGSAQAAAFTNGGFELASPDAAAGSFSTLGTGSTAISAWTVTSGDVDLVNGYWQAANGTHSVDLSGTMPGAISQTFDTVAGGLYTVNYFISGNPDGGSLVKALGVSAFDAATNTMIAQSAPTYSIQGASHAAMNYLPSAFSFTALGSSTTLSFFGLSDGPYGAVVDAVDVVGPPVPEPAVWAMMLGGFGFLGLALRRRRAVATVFA